MKSLKGKQPGSGDPAFVQQPRYPSRAGMGPAHAGSGEPADEPAWLRGWDEDEWSGPLNTPDEESGRLMWPGLIAVAMLVAALLTAALL